MNKQLEKPFEYLIRKYNEQGKETGKKEKFYSDIVNNWYKARAYVLDKMKDVSITPNEKKHLHVVIEGASPLMLSVVRQVALSAHFVNYDEGSGYNRTVVTIVGNGGDAVINELKKEEYLCNLLDYCKYTLNSNAKNEDSYIDIEFVVAQERPAIDEKTESEVYMCEKDVDSLSNSKFEEEIFRIDTSKAQYADRMYCLGTEIDNLPYDDIHGVERYSLALDVFLFSRIEKPLGKLVDEEEWEKEEKQADVLMALSNVYCSDCFLTRYNSIKPCWKDGKMTEKEAWKSEHARWVVEKLIMGYKPMSNKQKQEYGSLFGDARKQYAKKIKKDVFKELSHIDLCSFAELRRIDPDNMKYDSFLMLGIPDILRKVGEIPQDKPL